MGEDFVLVTGAGRRCNGSDVRSLGNTSQMHGHPNIVFKSSNLSNYRRDMFRVVSGSVSRTHRNFNGEVVVAGCSSNSVRIRSFKQNTPISFGGGRRHCG